MCWYGRAIVPILLLPFIAGSAFADAARIAVAQELADCAAFYLLVGDLPGMQNNVESQQPGEQAGIEAMQIASAYGNERLLLIRLRLAMESIKNELEQNWLKIMDVRDRYVTRCPALLAAPEDRVAYWTRNSEQQSP